MLLTPCTRSWSLNRHIFVYLGQVADQRECALPDVWGCVLGGTKTPGQPELRSFFTAFGLVSRWGPQHLARSAAQRQERSVRTMLPPRTWQHCSRASRRAVEAGAKAVNSASNRNPSASATPDSASRLHTM